MYSVKAAAMFKPLLSSKIWSSEKTKPFFADRMSTSFLLISISTFYEAYNIVIQKIIIEQNEPKSDVAS